MIVFFSVGNPGPSNRHSTGHYVLKHLMEDYGAKQLVSKGKYSASIEGELVFAKSNAYMNESHIALSALVQKEHVPADASVVVLYDDFELDLGKVRLSALKKNESHNGIRSMANIQLDIYKLGIGIGPKPSSASKETMAAWVLSQFRANEKALLDTKSIPLVIEYVDTIVDGADLTNYTAINARVRG